MVPDISQLCGTSMRRLVSHRVPCFRLGRFPIGVAYVPGWTPVTRSSCWSVHYCLLTCFDEDDKQMICHELAKSLDQVVAIVILFQ